MTTHSPAARVPLRLSTGTATFAIGVAGYLGVNLSPYMITATQEGLGLDILPASWIVTATLLITAVTGLAIAPLCAGAHRRSVARAGLLIGVMGFGLAAFVPPLIVPGLLAGGAGAGGAVAASGAALAAFRNPDRVAGFNGLANRGTITLVLAIVPLIGLAPIQVFGSLALMSLIGLAVSLWLPGAPTVDQRAAAAASSRARPAQDNAPARGRPRLFVGLGLLLLFALWAVSEDSLWAMAGAMGADQAGLSAAGLGVALSVSTAGGLLGSIVLMAAGNRLGRAVPLVSLLIVGGALKILEGFVTDPTTFIVVFVAWNTIYAVAFMYFVSTAAALDADGRWSGPLLAVYLVGSALTPVIGAALVSAFGYQGFVTVLGVASFAIAGPAGAIALASTRAERAERPTTEAVA